MIRKHERQGHKQHRGNEVHAIEHITYQMGEANDFEHKVEIDHSC